jgi:phage tail protein X
VDNRWLARRLGQSGRVAIDWGELRRLADLQLGLLTRKQCLAAGMTADAVDWRVGSRRWARVHEGVYQTTPGRADWQATATAALLFALSDTHAGDAALCGRSAAYLWGVESRQPAVVELLVPERRRVRAPEGARVRRSFRWDGVVDDLAFPWRTRPPATVLDVASSGTPIDALSLVARAVQKELVTPRELLQEITARGGHKHSKILRAALTDVADGAQSGAEVLYIRDVERAHGLPTATRQAPSQVGALRLHDNGYEQFGLIVEVDGRLGHEQWSDRVRDGRRDRQLLTRDRVTTRVFFADVAVRPCQTAGELAAILRSKGWAGRPRRCRRRGCTLA